MENHVNLLIMRSADLVRELLFYKIKHFMELIMEVHI